MGDVHPNQPWHNYLPALDRALLAIEHALLASNAAPNWTDTQRADALGLLEVIRQRWQHRIDPSAELDQLRNLCWDSPVASLTLVRANLELIRSWREELVLVQPPPRS
jgi:hypothetical protein